MITGEIGAVRGKAQELKFTDLTRPARVKERTERLKEPIVSRWEASDDEPR